MLNVRKEEYGETDNDLRGGQQRDLTDRLAGIVPKKPGYSMSWTVASWTGCGDGAPDFGPAGTDSNFSGATAIVTIDMEDALNQTRSTDRSSPSTSDGT